MSKAGTHLKTISQLCQNDIPSLVAIKEWISFIEFYVPSELDDSNSSSLVERVAQTPITSYYTYTDSSGYVWKMRDVSQKFSTLRLKDSIKKSGVNTKNTAKVSFYSRYWSDDSKTLARIGGEDYLTCTIYGVKVILNGE